MRSKRECESLRTSCAVRSDIIKLHLDQDRCKLSNEMLAPQSTSICCDEARSIVKGVETRVASEIMRLQAKQKISPSSNLINIEPMYKLLEMRDQDQDNSYAAELILTTLPNLCHSLVSEDDSPK